MSDGKPPNNHSSPHPRGFLERISYFLTGEPQDLDDILEILRDSQEKHLLDAEALTMMEGVMRISQMRVRDIMIPRSQMIVAQREQTLEEILPLVVDHAHSRFPVIADDRSKVVGVLLAKDLLAHITRDNTQTVEQIMRPVSVVPESKRLNVLLRDFRTTRHHMAIVVDEYGNAAGLITIEDILERIVGKIEDEHDEEDSPTQYILALADNEFQVKGLTPIEEFNAYFSAELEDDDCDTIGGLVVRILEHLPKRGEKLDIGKFSFEVMRADSRRVHWLRLKIK